MKSDPVVAIIDDESSITKSLTRILGAFGYITEAHASAEEYLAREPESNVACLILDLQMPGLNGIELQRLLRDSGDEAAIVFLTAHGDVATSVQAMKLGAVDFLTKPIDEMVLIQAVEQAVARQSRTHLQNSLSENVSARLETLTKREFEVMRGVVGGAMNKQIAARLEISEKTVKVHRAHLMSKMGTRSAAELVRLCAEANLLPDPWCDGEPR